MKTIYTVSREQLPEPRDPWGDAVGLNRTAASHEADLLVTARGLRQCTDLPKEVLERVAYEIVGEDVPESATREILEKKYARTPLELGRASMRMLDGGIGQSEA